MTDQPSVVLQLEAVNTVPGPISPVRPTLYLQCDDGRFSAYITTGAVLDEDQPARDAGFPNMTFVRVRWGSGRATLEEWERSTDYGAAFAPAPVDFLKQLLAIPDLRFEFHPFDAAPRVAIFNARALDRHIPKVKAACPILRRPTQREWLRQRDSQPQ